MRRRFNEFVDRHEVPWELTMAVLAVAFVVVGFASDDAGASLLPTLEAFDLALTVVFIAEFGSRFLASYDRRRYLRGHWIDLAVSLRELFCVMFGHRNAGMCRRCGRRAR